MGSSNSGLPFSGWQDLPISRSPSGLPLQHLVNEDVGSSTLYVGQQWLQTGERVLDHTHVVEEALIFLSGNGVAHINSVQRQISPNSSLYIPAGAVHGFTNTGSETMHVIVVFPVPYFAETTIVENSRGQTRKRVEPN